MKHLNSNENILNLVSGMHLETPSRFIIDSMQKIETLRI